ARHTRRNSCSLTRAHARFWLRSPGDFIIMINDPVPDGDSRNVRPVDHGATVNKNGPTMHLTRWLAAGAAALLLAAGTAMPQAAQAREIVGFSGNYSSGTIVVKTSERKLYYVLGNGKALRYPVGVGRIGKQWSGTAMISGKYLRPAWSPPADVK